MNMEEKITIKRYKGYTSWWEIVVTINDLPSDLNILFVLEDKTLLWRLFADRFSTIEELMEYLGDRSNGILYGLVVNALKLFSPGEDVIKYYVLKGVWLDLHPEYEKEENKKKLEVEKLVNKLEQIINKKEDWVQFHSDYDKETRKQKEELKGERRNIVIGGMKGEVTENKIYSESSGWVGIDEPIGMLFPIYRDRTLQKNPTDIRIVNCLRDDGFETIRDLLKKDPKELEKQLWWMPNFGKKSFDRLNEVLESYGFKRQMEWRWHARPY